MALEWARWWKEETQVSVVTPGLTTAYFRGPAVKAVPRLGYTLSPQPNLGGGIMPQALCYVYKIIF